MTASLFVGRARLAERFEALQAAGELRSDLTLNTLGRFLGVILDGLAIQQGSRFGIDVEGTIELVRSAIAPPAKLERARGGKRQRRDQQ